MWMTNFLGVKLIVNDHRRPQAPGAAGARSFVRYWWVHSKAARTRLNERYPQDLGLCLRGAGQL
jgi:hypothetical protein